ncbi:MAG: NUDIX hydrolase [Anaerolineae bacterium]|nr:NUDIX hydrolase [Anaerolineae bacterium]
MIPHWLDWSQRLQAIAQSGLTYTKNAFEIERYEEVREIAAEIAAAHSNLSQPEVEAVFEGQHGYATPKIDVRGVVFRDGKILLVKELKDGGWTLPGGWCDVGEPPSRATEREVYEESGYKAKATKLLALYDRNLHDHPPALMHIYKIFFLCELVGGNATTSIETGGAEFFAEDALPPLSTPRTTEAQLHRFFEHSRHPDWPTDFD